MREKTSAMASDDMGSLSKLSRRQIVGFTSACDGSECPTCLLINLLPVSRGMGIQMSSFRFKTGMVNKFVSQNAMGFTMLGHPSWWWGGLRVARTIIASHS